MNKVRVGLLGYGGIGPVHAMAYKNVYLHYGLPESTIQIMGIAESSPEKAERAAQAIGCEWWTSDYRELLARDDIDAVDILVPNNLHYEVVLAAADAGKHIFCEKPLAMNPTEAEEMTAAVQNGNLKSQVNFNFRFFPAVLRARQLIEEGCLGRIFSFRACFYRSSYIDSDKPISWRLRKEIAGGGALFDLGSHVLDLCYFLLGETRRVYAKLETFIAERPIRAGSSDKGKVDVDDFCLLMLEMNNGAFGSVEISRMGTGATNDLRIEIFGDRGAIKFNSEDPNWIEYFDATDDPSPLGGLRGYKRIETVNHYEGQLVPHWTMAPGFLRTFTEGKYRFVKAILEEKPTDPSFTTGLYIQYLLEAAQIASKENRWVDIPDMQ